MTQALIELYEGTLTEADFNRIPTYVLQGGAVWQKQRVGKSGIKEGGRVTFYFGRLGRWLWWFK